MAKNEISGVFIAKSAQQSAEHYNIMIWTIFSVGVALSLLILFEVWSAKLDIRAMQFVMSFFGLLVLFYCALAIESFGQKRSLMYEICNKKIGLKLDLPYFKLEWIAEIILFGIFLLYLIFFGFILFKNSLTIESFTNFVIPLEWVIFFISLILVCKVISNWFRRPKSESGNWIENIRKTLMGNKLKSYEELGRIKK